MREKLLAILTETCPGIDFTEDAAFVDDGILESLDIVMIVSELMHTFRIEIGVDDLLPENFNSIDAMAALIRSKQ